ncbi:MAG: GatB/YqeY domain-containing protein [Acidimicrobiia bacterium]|nr:GatB/YqeY domain-containing protein [Acidimicrobiia bacterium]
MSLFARLKADLSTALREGDGEAVAVLRALMAAIANAEAVELDPTQPRDVEGLTEGSRRRLTPDDLSRILRREAAELHSAAGEYEGRGRPDQAARLRHRAGLVEGYLGGPS